MHALIESTPTTRSFAPSLLRSFALIGALWFLSGCLDPSSPLDGEVASLVATRSAGEVWQSAGEEDLFEIATEVPSYGGHYFSPDGRLVVWVKDLTEADAARSAMRARVANTRIVLSHAAERVVIESRRADFTLRELASARDAVLGAARSLDLVMLDLDEGSNRVTLGVEPGRDYGEESSLMARLRELDIPMAVLRFVEFARTEPTSDESLLLQSATHLGAFADTLAAGFRYWWNPAGVPNYSKCTIGFTVAYTSFASAGTKGFLSASHCSPTKWGMDGVNAVIDQPGDFSLSTSIGHELNDLSGGTCPFLWVGCGSYRFSDANINYVSGRPVKVGYIAKPNTRSGHVPSADTTIVPGTYIKVVAQTSSIVQGSTVDKVGSTTGWTSGAVNHTCFTYFGDSPKWLRCAYAFSAITAGGDSGGPVFYYNAGADEATAVGIVAASGMEQGVAATIFSKLSLAQTELSGPGSFSVVAGTVPSSFVPSVSVAGVSEMQAGASCYWYVSANFAYTSVNWSVNGVTVGTNYDLAYSATNSFVLEVSASNGTHSAFAIHPVSISTEANSCEPE